MRHLVSEGLQEAGEDPSSQVVTEHALVRALARPFDSRPRELQKLFHNGSLALRDREKAALETGDGRLGRAEESARLGRSRCPTNSPLMLLLVHNAHSLPLLTAHAPAPPLEQPSSPSSDPMKVARASPPPHPPNRECRSHADRASHPPLRRPAPSCPSRAPNCDLLARSPSRPRVEVASPREG